MKAYGTRDTKRVAYRGARVCGSDHAPGDDIAAAVRSQKKAARRAAKKDIEQWLEVLDPDPEPDNWGVFFEADGYLDCDWDEPEEYTDHGGEELELIGYHCPHCYDFGCYSCEPSDESFDCY